MYPSLRPNWLFDCDGTLLDTRGLHDTAFRRALRSHLPELEATFHYDAVKGRATREAFASLGAEGPLLQVLTATKQRVYRELIAQGSVVLLPGALHLLNSLRILGFGLFLVTSGSQGSVRSALLAAGIERLFRGVIAAEDVTVGKPAPEPYLCCLQRFALRAQDCVVVEDSLSGVQAATSARIPVIGVHDTSIVEAVDAFFSSLSKLEVWIDWVRTSEAATS